MTHLPPRLWDDRKTPEVYRYRAPNLRPMDWAVRFAVTFCIFCLLIAGAYILLLTQEGCR